MTVAVPPPASFPFEHIPVMIFAWISFLLYLNLVVALLRKKNRPLLTSYPVYSILLYNSIGDVCMFLHAEFVMRPRTYRLFPFYNESTPAAFAYFSYFTVCLLGNVMLLSYIPLAANRFTAFAYPLQYRKIWKPSNIFSYTVIIWMISAFLALIVLEFPSSKIGFRLYPSGTLQLDADDFTLLKDTIILAVTAFLVCLICCCFYGCAALLSRKATRTFDVERKLFFGCLLVSLPLLIESFRGLLCLFATLQNLPDIMVLAGKTWFYWTEVMASLPCWSILLMSPTARNLAQDDGFLRMRPLQKGSVAVTAVTGN